MQGALVSLAAAAAMIAGSAQAAPTAPEPDTPLLAATSSASADDRLMALFRDDARREDTIRPLGVLYRGGRADPASFALTYSDAQTAALRGSVARSLGQLKRIDRRALSAERQISYDVFVHDKQAEQTLLSPRNQALTAVRPFSHFGGMHIEFPTIMGKGGAAAYADADDYRHNLALLRAFPTVLDNAEVQWRRGIRSGVVDTRLTVTNMIGQLDALLAIAPGDSAYMSPVTEFPAGMGTAERSALTRDWQDAVGGQIYPAYRKLRAFLHDEYLPVARQSVGLSQMKGGAGLYRLLIEGHTTLKLSPDAVHALGLTEVARIQREMTGVERELGYSVPLRGFFDEIRTNPKFHPTTAAQLSGGFAAIGKAVDAQIPQYFLRTPRTGLLIQPYPAYREKYEAGGSYNQGSGDASRPGTFFYNTYDLPSRFLTGMTTLYLHEAIPGHHFQISLAQENVSLPDFQRFGGNTAFVEGWALYAETLGYPMGLYKDPMQHWGTLDDEMLRAMRLVVDTGIHAKGWSREQAIDYMLANSGMGRTDATAEVERYIAWPGQALAYKIGAMTIQRLRKQAETALGARFDIRAFHEQVLGSGALPLPILEAKIDRWIAAQTAKGN